MAGEITFALTMTVDKNSFYFQFDPGTMTFDLSGAGGGNPGMVSIGTSEEDISFGDVSGNGWVLMVNLDASSSIDWGASATTPTLATIGTLTGGTQGGFAVWQMKSGATLRAKSNGGAAAKAAVHAFEP